MSKYNNSDNKKDAACPMGVSTTKKPPVSVIKRPVTDKTTKVMRCIEDRKVKNPGTTYR